MNIPNKITLFRFLLSLIFIFLFFREGAVYKLSALIVFILAAASDFIDGYIAKKYQMETDFGRIMDPVADKLLTLSAFVSFWVIGLIPLWMVSIIVVRELVITGLRIYALRKDHVLAAGRGGKHKTAFQMTSIIAILIFVMIKDAGEKYFLFWNESIELWYARTIYALMFITVFLTVLSGLSYLAGNKKYLSIKGKSTKYEQ